MNLEDALNDAGAQLAAEYADYDAAQHRAQLEDLISGNWVENWPLFAACRGMDPDELFIPGAAQNRAKTVCASCPVRTECLADALDSRVEFGVWGGMTERERRALLRRRPDVRSWRRVLEGKRELYLRQRASTETAQDATPVAPARPTPEDTSTRPAARRAVGELAHPATAPVPMPTAVPEEDMEAVKRLEDENARLLSRA